MSKKPTKRFTVGTGKNDDFTPDEIADITYELAQWFMSPECDRNPGDPWQEAKDVVHQCLLAEKKDGGPWKSCPKEFNARVRVKAQYDLETGQGTAISPVKHPEATRSRKDEAKARATSQQVKNAPVPTQFDVKQYRADLEREVITAFPELDNPVSMPNIERLTLLYAEQKKLEDQLTSGLLTKQAAKKEAYDNLKQLEIMIDRTMKLLDIHPNQLRAKMDKQREGTLGDLIATLESDTEFEQREDDWALQEAYQLFYMLNHPNGRGNGPQMTEWEFFHRTRTRPFNLTCSCGREFKNLIDGFTPIELRDYLIKKGMKLEEPAVPGMMSAEDLEGINDWDPSTLEVEEEAESEVEESEDADGDQ